MVCAGMLLAATLPGHAAELRKRVLTIDSFGRYAAPYTALDSSFRTTLVEELGQAVDFYDASLDMARFANGDRESLLVDFLDARFKERPLDLVVPIGAPAVQFTWQHRERLFPNVPIVFTGATPRLMPSGVQQGNATFVTQDADLPGMVEDILQMQPQTTNIVVVIGASPLERFWAAELRRELEVFGNRIGFTWLDGLPLAQVEARCAKLPPNSFILYTMFLDDPTGAAFNDDDPLRRLHAVANAPVFGYFNSTLGRGAIGGRLYQDAEIGARAARIAVRVLRGERADSIAPDIIDAPVPVYDWRELQRWGISEKRLPAGSVIRFRQLTFWEVNRWWIIAVIAFCGFQTSLIVGLLINRTKRRTAEIEARNLHGRLLVANEQERARLARELHDDVTQRLARLAIDAGQLERAPTGPKATEAMSSIREGLVRLSEDIHALSYQLHPSTLNDLGLETALHAECEQFTQRESIPVKTRFGEIPQAIPRETALCLFRVVQESLRNAGRHSRARTVEIVLRSLDDGLQVAIRDDGIGFNPNIHTGAHLGLASMRERVQLLGGELDIESAHGHGTTILGWVPLQEDRR